MRLTVSLIINLVANGLSFAEIVGEYPDLEPEDIQPIATTQPWIELLNRCVKLSVLFLTLPGE
jgi:hypothetical protein